MTAAPVKPRRAKVVRKVRTEHGTRVARRIRCSACGSEDTIDFAPKDLSQALCRRCAFDRYGAVDLDDRATRQRQQICSQCGRAFEGVVMVRPDEPPECPDCKAGILSQQGDRARGAVRLSPKVVRARRAPPKNED